MTTKLNKWLKGQESEKKETKPKNVKTTVKTKTITRTTRTFRAVPAKSLIVTPPTPRTRILASRTRTTIHSGPINRPTVRNVITVIPEGRKEIHFSVGEFGKGGSSSRAPHRIIQEPSRVTVASINKTRKSIRGLPITSSRNSKPSPGKVVRSGAPIQAVSNRATDIPVSGKISQSSQAVKIEPVDRSSQSRRSKASTTHSNGVKSPVLRTQDRENLPKASTKTSPSTTTLDPESTPILASRRAGEMENTISASAFPSGRTVTPKRPTRTTRTTSVQPVTATRATPGQKTTPPIKGRATAPTQPGISTLAIHSPPPITNPYANPNAQPPRTNPKPKPKHKHKHKHKRQPNVLKLPSDLILKIISYTPYPSTVFLKLTCKHLYTTIPISHQHPSPTDQLSVLRAFPPLSIRPGERHPPILCPDCLIWHSFEHMTLYPHPRPESVFLSYADYRIQRPRKCVRFAVKSGEWKRGEVIDGEGRYVLCEECGTPKERSSGMCAWNCGACGGCSDRRGWSGVCKHCWREGDREEVGNGGGWSSNGSGTPSTSEEKRRTCWRCLGVLDGGVGDREVCRCLE